MSLEEWQTQVEGAHQRTEVQYQMLLHLAWHTAYLTRVEHTKFPTLAKHLKQFEPKKPAKADSTQPHFEWWQVSQDMMRSMAARKKDAPALIPPKKRKGKPQP